MTDEPRIHVQVASLTSIHNYAPTIDIPLEMYRCIAEILMTHIRAKVLKGTDKGLY